SGLGGSGTGSGGGEFGKGGSLGSKGSGTVTASSGEPIVMGGLDRSLIDAVIKRKMSQIKYCYQRELQKDPSLSGKLTVQFTIAKDGSVSQAKVASSTLGSAAVDQCVVQRFFQMQFPEPKGGGIVVVKYPFIFSGG
ncbi:MAG TPA: AgmX/PglI C-terminal domain-containing protein, partial [Myxococcota bacterium]|nr:AgmX/PglI C-terminal domain-containing protein [Myxococcota bacterium]